MSSASVRSITCLTSTNGGTLPSCIRTASTSVYTGSGTRVDIGGQPTQGVPGDPTGAVFSGISGQFRVGTEADPTALDTSNFVFDSEDGTISAWRIGSTAAQVTVDMSS